MMTTEDNGPQQVDPALQTEGHPESQHVDTQKPEADAGSGVENPFEALSLEQDTREWAVQRGYKSIEDVIKTAHEQHKMLGNALRVPGKDAKPEELEAFYEKLGRPKTADEYDFKPPESLPENLPYDGERAKSFAETAHKLGLTKAQAAAIHDWAVKNAVDDFTGATAQRNEQDIAIAKGETEKLIKLWGPLDGTAMKTNLSFADKVLREVGGEDVVSEFQRVGLIGSDGAVIKSAPIAVMLSRLGAALYKEDDVLRGRPDRLDNPFAEGDAFNVTAQMKLIREDKQAAMAMIAAAGKKPSDFGLKA